MMELITNLFLVTKKKYYKYCLTKDYFDGQCRLTWGQVAYIKRLEHSLIVVNLKWGEEGLSALNAGTYTSVNPARQTLHIEP